MSCVYVRLHVYQTGLLCAVQVVVYKLLHPPVALVQSGLRMKGSKAKEGSKFAFIAAFRGRQAVTDGGGQQGGVMQSRMLRVGRAGGVATPKSVSKKEEAKAARKMVWESSKKRN